MARQPLGRGLSELLGDTNTGGGLEIGLEQIESNPEQPRARFSDEALEELAQSIRSNGVIQPIVVRRKGEKYQIVAGERRWRAAQRAGLRKIPAFVREVSDEKLLELALVENIQRQDLNPIEEAHAYRKLIDIIGLTQELVAERVGKERSMVATSLRLLKLPNDIQRLIEEEKLSAGHGRALLVIDDPKVQRAIANSAADMSLSVRQTERAIKRSASAGRQASGNKRVMAPPLDANVKLAEAKLIRRFGTNVKITPKGKSTGGKIQIEYYSDDDLDRIYQLLMDK